MGARRHHAVHQSRDTSFQTECGDVTLHVDTYVDKSKLYTLKRKVLRGTAGLDIKTYRHFRLHENGQIDPIAEKWAMR